MSKAKISGAVWGRYLRSALIWLIPAVLLLPLYLLLVLISVFASDGTLLEATGAVRGGVNAAMGPLLLLCGLVAGIVTALAGTTAADYVEGGFFALVCVGLGIVLVQRGLRRLAAEPAKG